MNKKLYTSTFAVVVLFFILGGVCYHNALDAEFVLDGRQRILFNKDIRQLWPPGHFLKGTNRPLIYLSFALNYALGQEHVLGYHVFNIIVHVLAALVLLGILRRTFQRAVMPLWVRQRGRGLALASALIWLAHPLQTASVTYIFQRSESIMGLFYLLTVYLSLRYFEEGRTRWGAMAMLCCLAGMASKAIMVTAPFMVLCYDRMFFSGSFRQSLRSRCWFYFSLALTWALLAMLLSGPHRSRGTVGFDIKEATAWEYLLSQPGVILHYLRLSFWPRPLVLDYGWPVARSAARIIPPLFAIAALLIGTIRACCKKDPAGFLGVWFFLILLPTSSFIPIADLAFEHRMYLPLAAVITGVVVTMGFLTARLSPARQALANKVMLCSVLGVFCFMTAQRNEVYRDRVRLWEDVVAKRPGNARAMYNLGLRYLELGNKQKAKEYYQKAVDVRDDYARAHNNLGNMYYEEGQVSEAVRHFEKALLSDPTAPETYNNYGVVLMEIKQYSAAEPYLKKAVELDPSGANTVKNLGNLYYLQGRFDLAATMYQQALKLEPGLPAALAPLGDICYKRKEYGMAELMYLEYLRFSPDQPVVHNSLGVVYLEQGKIAEAIRNFKHALELDPSYESAWNNLGLAQARERKQQTLP